VRYLLDTNIISEPLRPRPAPGIMRRLREHEEDIAIAAPVWHELRFGCLRLTRSTRKQAVERYLGEVAVASFPVLEHGLAAGDWHAGERARLTAAGGTPPVVDGQIAAIAFVNKMTLVTANTRDFQGFQGLKVQNWA